MNKVSIKCHTYTDRTRLGLLTPKKCWFSGWSSQKHAHDLWPWQVVVPGDAKGGRFVRWGGLHGRLCLADGDLALEEHQQFGVFSSIGVTGNWMLLKCKVTNHEGYQGMLFNGFFQP